MCASASGISAFPLRYRISQEYSSRSSVLSAVFLHTVYFMGLFFVSEGTLPSNNKEKDEVRIKIGRSAIHERPRLSSLFVQP